MVDVGVTQPRRRSGFLARARSHRAFLGSALFIGLVALAAILAPWISPYDPTDAAGFVPNQPIGADGYLLGTDNQGRDLLSRLLWGGRISLLVALVPTLIAMVISLFLGLIAGYFRGWFDSIIMRVLDMFFAFPLVLLAVAIAGVLRPGVTTEIIAITIVLIPYISRLARTSTVAVAQQPYIEAARAAGGGTLALLLRYVLPNMFPPVLVYTTTLIGLMIVVGAGLSFLGLGVQPPTPDWGAMVGEGASVLRKAPHVTILPGVVIVVMALAFNILGDSLHNLLDPRGKNRGS